ncbi:MAG: Minf_1886 family protein [Phycisphaerales bacterium]
MSTSQPPQLDLVQIVASGPYPMEAFNFVRDGLGYTSERVHGSSDGEGSERHVSGQDLCRGLRDYAVDRYGFMAPSVLGHWNIRRTDDFGRIVFSLIENGYMSKTDDDTLEDFCGVFDFGEDFGDEALRRSIGRG